MRRWLVLLMVLLLPLRGWAGDFMSVQMATMNAAPEAVAAMPADCPMHTGAHAPDAGESTSAHTGGGLQNCSSCELCIPLAELASGGLESVNFAVHGQPLMPSVNFASTSLAPVVKPPIS